MRPLKTGCKKAARNSSPAPTPRSRFLKARNNGLSSGSNEENEAQPPTLIQTMLAQVFSINATDPSDANLQTRNQTKHERRRSRKVLRSRPDHQVRAEHGFSFWFPFSGTNSTRPSG